MLNYTTPIFLLMFSRCLAGANIFLVPFSSHFRPLSAAAAIRYIRPNVHKSTALHGASSSMQRSVKPKPKHGAHRERRPPHAKKTSAPRQAPIDATLLSGHKEDAKAARSAIVAALPRTSTAAVKQFVDMISLDINMETTRQLELPSRGIVSVPTSLGMLYKEIRKLNLSSNQLTDVSPLASLDHLSNLNLSDNPKLTSLKGLGGSFLTVLNISRCAVHSLAGLERSATTLCTLIANDNDIRLQSPSITEPAQQSLLPSSWRVAEWLQPDTVAMENFRILAGMQQCETVVLSRNAALMPCYPAVEGPNNYDTTAPATKEDASSELEEDSEVKKARRAALTAAHPLSVFEQLPRLRKLSLSGCNLHSLPARWFLPLVTELRVAQNSLHSFQPEGVILRSLQILDISSNLLTSIGTLRRCMFLQQLGLRGNPVEEECRKRDREDGLATTTAEGQSPAASVSLHRSVRRLFPNVRLLDGQPLLSAEQLQAISRSRKKTVYASKTSASTVQVEDDTTEDCMLKSDGGSRPTMESAEARKRRREAAAAAVLAETEEKDVVLDLSTTVGKTTQTSIVRRERVIPRPDVQSASRRGSGNSSIGGTGNIYGQAAVAKLLERTKEKTSW